MAEPAAIGLTRADRRWVWGIATAAAALYVLAGLSRQARLRTGFDLTIFDQLLQRYAHFQAPYVLVKSQADFNLLGDHFHPILILLTPLYWIWPDARVLLVGQGLLIAVGVLLLTRFAVRRLGRTGLLVGAAFALSWGLLRAISFDFHEIAVAVPALVLAMAALVEHRWRSLIIWSVVLLLVKEDSAFLVAGFALVLLAWRRYRLAIGFAVGSVAAFLLTAFVVIPIFSYTGRYTYLGYAGDGSGVLGIAGRMVSNLFSLPGLTLVALLAITAGIGLRSPLVLALIPTLLARLASSYQSYLFLPFHYNATLMVICAVALVEGLRRTRAGAPTGPSRLWLRGQAVIGGAVVIFSIATGPTVGDLARWTQACPTCGQALAVAARVPDGARVIADVRLGPQLVDRAQVLLAVPEWTDSTGIPLEADWVLLDLASTAGGNPTPGQVSTPDPGWVQQRIDLLAGRGYRMVEREGSFVLLTRSAG